MPTKKKKIQAELTERRFRGHKLLIVEHVDAPELKVDEFAVPVEHLGKVERPWRCDLAYGQFRTVSELAEAVVRQQSALASPTLATCSS